MPDIEKAAELEHEAKEREDEARLAGEAGEAPHQEWALLRAQAVRLDAARFREGAKRAEQEGPPARSANEPSLSDGLRAAAARRFCPPIAVPQHATPVKDSSGAITAFHWTAQAPAVRQHVTVKPRMTVNPYAARRMRVALPRRSVRGCGRPPARRTSSAASRDGPGDSDDPEPARRGDRVGDTSRVPRPLRTGAVA
jgi:hypothetical protein